MFKNLTRLSSKNKSSFLWDSSSINLSLIPAFIRFMILICLSPIAPKFEKLILFIANYCLSTVDCVLFSFLVQYLSISKTTHTVGGHLHMISKKSINRVLNVSVTIVLATGSSHFHFFLLMLISVSIVTSSAVFDATYLQ